MRETSFKRTRLVREQNVSVVGSYESKLYVLLAHSAHAGEIFKRIRRVRERIVSAQNKRLR
jgi:hypothetical protein